MQEIRDFVCPNAKCGRRYKNHGHLQRHLRYECGKEPQFPCQLCSKRFMHKSSLKKHYVCVHVRNPDLLL